MMTEPVDLRQSLKSYDIILRRAAWSHLTDALYKTRRRHDLLWLSARLWLFLLVPVRSHFLRTRGTWESRDSRFRISTSEKSWEKILRRSPGPDSQKILR